MDKLLICWLTFCIFHIGIEAKNVHFTISKPIFNKDIIEVGQCFSTLTNRWEQQSHPTNCRWYISCMNDIGITQECPNELYFNPEIGLCDLPGNVVCGESTTTTVSEESTTDTTWNEATGTTANDGSTTDTTIDGSTVDTTIEDGTTSMSTDQYETTVPTSKDSETTTDQTETTVEDDVTTEEIDSTMKDGTTTESTTESNCVPLCTSLLSSGGEIADPNHCDRFISCTDRCRGGTMFCPSSLHFNSLTSVCDLPERAECLLEVCVDQPTGAIPSVNSCHHYYECKNANAIRQICGSGLVFDPELTTCVPEDADNTCTVQDIPAPPPEVYMQCTPTVVEQHLRHPTRCDVFYRCIRGMLSGRMCLDGLLFDESLGMCNLEELVDCVDETEKQ